MARQLSLVTGASAGIGEAISRVLASRGDDLILVARREPALEKLAKDLERSNSVTCDVLAADLSEPASVETVAKQITTRSVDTVVNNAGFGTYGTFQKLPLDHELEEIRLNVEALVALSHAALGVFVPRRSGRLLNVASTASFQPGPKNATYSATKAFVRSFTEALHEEVRTSNVHVTALCPGFTPTEFQARAGMQASGVPKFMWSDSATVAAAGIAALDRNHALCVPGVVNRFSAEAVRLAPRGLARRMAGRVLDHM